MIYRPALVIIYKFLRKVDRLCKFTYSFYTNQTDFSSQNAKKPQNKLQKYYNLQFVHIYNKFTKKDSLPIYSMSAIVKTPISSKCDYDTQKSSPSKIEKSFEKIWKKIYLKLSSFNKASVPIC